MEGKKIYVPMHVAKTVNYDMALCNYSYVLVTLDGLICLKEDGYNGVIEYCIKNTASNGFSLCDELLVDWFVEEDPDVNDIPVQGVGNPMLFNHICSQLYIPFVHIYVREQFANHLNERYNYGSTIRIATSYRYKED